MIGWHKQNEIYFELRQVVDKKYWNEICPKPPDEVIQFRKRHQADKRKAKNTKKNKEGDPTENKKRAEAAPNATTSSPLPFADV